MVSDLTIAQRRTVSNEVTCFVSCCHTASGFSGRVRVIVCVKFCKFSLCRLPPGFSRYVCKLTSYSEVAQVVNEYMNVSVRGAPRCTCVPSKCIPPGLGSGSPAALTRIKWLLKTNEWISRCFVAYVSGWKHHSCIWELQIVFIFSNQKTFCLKEKKTTTMGHRPLRGPHVYHHYNDDWCAIVPGLTPAERSSGFMEYSDFWGELWCEGGKKDACLIRLIKRRLWKQMTFHNTVALQWQIKSLKWEVAWLRLSLRDREWVQIWKVEIMNRKREFDCESAVLEKAHGRNIDSYQYQQAKDWDYYQPKSVLLSHWNNEIE